MDPKKLEQWREEAIESFEEAKEHFASEYGKKAVLEVLTEILGPDFPGSPDTLHTMREEDILKATFYAHCMGVSRVVDTLIRMIRDGVLNPDGDRAREVAARLDGEGVKEEMYQFKAGAEIEEDDGTELT
jgi:hypothetical protein